MGFLSGARFAKSSIYFWVMYNYTVHRYSASPETPTEIHKIVCHYHYPPIILPSSSTFVEGMLILLACHLITLNSLIIRKPSLFQNH